MSPYKIPRLKVQWVINYRLDTTIFHTVTTLSSIYNLL